MTDLIITSSANKPTTVKVFWWLSVTLVAYMIFTRAWFLVFPTAHYVTTLAHLRPEFRELARRADIDAAIISTTIWCVPILVLAWLSTFGRANWARWAFAMLFLLAEASDLLIAASYHQLHGYVADLLHSDWLYLPQYVVPVLWLAAIGLSFSRNARPWFR